METIAQAVQDGYRDVNTLKSHKYLDALRERDDYKSLVSRLAKAVEADNLVANEAKTDLQKLANHRESANLLRELAGDDSTDMRHRETLASTLHSIGEIQLGLRQYNEAEKTLLESLEIRKRLQEEAHGDPQAAIDVLTLQNSLGSLEWAKRNYANAHQQWKQVLSQSLRLAETHRDVTLVQERLSAEERRIAGHYGSIGLWPLVEEWMQRNVKFGRGNHGIDDGEFSAAILASGNRELAKSYYRKRAETLPSENIEWYRVIDLARGIATVGDITLLSDELKERALSVFEE